MRWNRSKRRRHAAELASAQGEARASLTQAATELARQREAARQEQAAVIGPLRKLIEVNHFADMLARQLHPGGD